MKSSQIWSKLSVLFIVLLAQGVYGQAFIQIETTPNVVQSVDATLTFGFALSKPLPSGSWMRLKFPEEMKVSTNIESCRETQNFFVVTDCSANLIENWIELKVDLDLIPQGSITPVYNIQLLKAVNTPMTIKVTDPIVFQNQNSESMQTVFGATIGTLEKVDLQPISDVVGQDTSLQVKIKTTNKIPRRGKIVIQANEIWNLGAIEKQKEYFKSITCDSLKVEGQDDAVDMISYKCNLLFSPTRVVIEEAFEEGDIPANAEISWNINGFRNPIQSNDRFQVFEVYTTGNDIKDRVDILADAYVEVTTAAHLLDVNLKPHADVRPDIRNMVQEANNLELTFNSPIPFRPGCQISYQFPKAFFNVNEITELRTGALFSSNPEIMTPIDFEIKDEKGGYSSINFKSCPVFRKQGVPETTKISGMNIPLSTEETGSIRIYIKDADGTLIIFEDEGVSITPYAGIIDHISTSITPTTVSALSYFTFEIKPQHSIIGAEQPEIKITFPEEFQVQFGCDQPLNCFPQLFDNSITVQNIFGDKFEGGETLKFSVGPLKLYQSTMVVQKDFVFTSLFKGRRNPLKFYVVDQGIGTPILEMTSGTVNLQLELSNYQSFMKSDITFKFVSDHVIPQYGNIMITMPDQLDFDDASFSQSQCKDWTNFASNSGVCQIFMQNRTLIVSKGFMQAASKQGQTELSFTLPQMTNPPTLDTTGTFYLKTMDQNFHTIDETKQEVTLKMQKQAYFRTQKVSVSEPQNGVESEYTFDFVTSTTIFPKEFATVTFPPQLTLPSTVLCYVTSKYNNNAEVPCSKGAVFNQIVAKLSNLQIIYPKEQWSLRVSKVTNAISTEPTAQFVVMLYDSESLSVPTNSDYGGLIVQNSIPFQIEADKATMLRDNKLPGKDAFYTIRVKLQHNIQAGGGVLIRFPPQIRVDQPLEVSVDMSQFLADTILTKPMIDTSARQIMYLEDNFKNSIVIDPSQQKEMVIKFNKFINPMTNEKSSNFEIVTFNQKDNVLYFIDEAKQGMFIENNCNYPCVTCQTTNPNYCTGCDWNTKLNYLEEGTCLEECSKGQFFTERPYAYHCKSCDYSCLECELNANRCTTCGIPGFIHLRETECVDDCGKGYINDPENHMCLKCREGCSECDRDVNNCTACDIQGKTPYIFGFDCLKECPKDISVLQDFECTRCDGNCKTCSNLPNQCTSCESHQRLDINAKKCVDACKADLQIYDPVKDSCLDCDASCETCSGTTDSCSSCRESTSLNFDNKCRAECEGGDDDKFQQVKDQTCQYCENPCRTCEKENLAVCTSCIISDDQEDLRYLYNKTCLDHCPLMYEPNGEEPNQCILVGLICPEGFHVNDLGDGCIPNQFECKVGYEINDKNTACIPLPGTPIPFPFLFFGICMTLVVAYSKLKESKNTRVITSLIMFLGAFELLQYLLMGIQSIVLEQYAAGGLCFLGFFLMIGTNIGFTVMYKRSILGDVAFKNWIRIYNKTRILIPILCCLINFKFIRFVFSGFMGLENTEAVFKNPQFSIHRPLKFVTYFKYVFVYGPIFIADILILINLEWGHQLSVLAIETFIMQLAIIVLTYLEFKDLQNMYQQDEVMYSPIKRGVMAGVVDHDIHEKNLFRKENECYKYEIVLRRKALAGIIKQVFENFDMNKNQVDMGNDIPGVYTKFEKNQLVIKRAFSMVDLQGPQHNSDATLDGTRSSTSESSGDDIIFKRRYSFPLEGLEDDVADPVFENQLNEIRQAMIEQKYKDNCYAEPKEEENPAFKNMAKRKKMVNRRTQTYLKELLMLDGEDAMDSDMEIMLEEDIEIDDKYTRAIIDGVISDGFSDSDIEEEEPVHSSQRIKHFKKDKGITAKVSKTGKRPDFQLEDIMGKFEIDDSGNYIILRGDDGSLLDKDARIVNKRGYLIDRIGNIINNRHELIFKRTELDDDGEIPAPIGFDMRKQNLLDLQNKDNIDEMIDTITQEMVPMPKKQLKQSESMSQSQMEMINPKASGNNTMPQAQKSRIQSSHLPRYKNLPQNNLNSSSKDFSVPQILGEEIQPAGPESVEDIMQQTDHISNSNLPFQNNSLEGPKDLWGQKQERPSKWNNFYQDGTGTNKSAQLSQFGDETDYINEGLLQRPGTRGRAANFMERDASSFSQQRPLKKKKASVSGARVKSGDPRLKNLEAIYLKKFGHSNSAMNMKFNKGLANTVTHKMPPKAVRVNNFRTNEFTVDGVGSYRNGNQLQVANEIDQMEQQYLKNNQMTRVEQFGDDQDPRLMNKTDNYLGAHFQE